MREICKEEVCLKHHSRPSDQTICCFGRLRKQHSKIHIAKVPHIAPHLFVFVSLQMDSSTTDI